jgi:hypothetical protein
MLGCVLEASQRGDGFCEWIEHLNFRIGPVYNVVGVVKIFFHITQANLQHCELERGQGRPREAGRLSETLDAA